ncbi:type IV conjugative transfer system coupling protein TraD [Sphingobium jiangsuense]|uniref:Type IV conjugative transfer system coupling protein TraD n=1 Tax=Sphingobium jiangsuense TaxID=870476 RepID=A0A7W6BR80_9SPHN|nr:type IV secretion system DNA-binding domain-containing protein [Sphingobium jiangsuense]MBB3928585.1 type IV conjugative transfer system coupling protein TraD [Sphingobium jiangsuense]GLT01049.1 type IV conjugative transfer system coupling protein TraD [Sphingobium jiangsuense]
MSIFRNDTLGSWTRGGQAIVHNVRMTTQVFFQTMIVGLVIWVMGTGWYALEKSTEYQRFVLTKLVEASFKVDAAPGTNDPVLFRTPEGRQYWTSADILLESGVARKALHKLEKDLIHGAAIAGVGTILALAWAWFYFTRTGKGLGSNEYIRGARFGTAGELRQALAREKKGSFRIGGVPVPDAYESEHILICGAPGTGKTNLITTMLEGIRKKGKRAIVYDTAGSFVEKFYRHGHDVLLNPLDQRTDIWSPWVDVPQEYHYDQIAESTIPDKHGDPFWSKAARGTLVAVLRKLARQKHTLISVLLERVLRSPLADLAAFVKGTDAAAFISTEGERTSAGVQAELASVMRSFAYLDDTEDAFSIRKWVENEKDDSWLFITVKADQLPSLRPLITVWLDIAISAIMSLAPDRKRRLYCVIDELTTLQKLPSLSDFLARARKYGGCGILGFQSYPQLNATYGKEDAAAITGYCSTWVALRANDTDTAELVSKNLGRVEQIEANEGMSYGVNDMRDGVNLSRMQVTRPLVLDTEVTNLPNLTGYLRFGRNLPVVRFLDSFNPIASICPAFVERESPPKRLPVGGEIIAHVRAASRARAAAERDTADRDAEGSSPPQPRAEDRQPDLFGNRPPPPKPVVIIPFRQVASSAIRDPHAEGDSA